MKYISSKCVVASGLLLASCGGAEESQRPNVIVGHSDDQGIANLSGLGNPYISPPAIDQFAEQSVSLTDFHVCPLSTPTRSSIITGRYPIRNGAWATFKGRDVVSRFDGTTIAEVFQSGGYATALFGKWHLGDNYPSRATDCGFEHAVQHSSGGVGELSDYWGNTYFDDVYLYNNRPTQFSGYCTDVWFSQVERYLDKRDMSGDRRPFFIYLATNAPHSPHRAPEEYTKKYEEVAAKGIIKDAGYYGQIENLDDNFGQLMNYLDVNNLADNTIVIFTTDNGAPPANNPYTMGYRGGKSSPLEGGHRVPCFIRWNKRGVKGGDKVDGLAAHIDLIPTLASMCGIDIDKSYAPYLDGMDISQEILNRKTKSIDPSRRLFIHHRQSQEQPFDVKNSVVMEGRWRLISGNQLFDVVEDRAQNNNVASEYPEVVERLSAANKEFMSQTKEMPAYTDLVPQAIVGTEHQPISVLTIQHAMGSGPGLWKSEQIAEGVRNGNSQYCVEFASDGSYSASFARWPREALRPNDSGMMLSTPSINPKEYFEYKPLALKSVRLTIKTLDGKVVKEYIRSVAKGDNEVVLKFDIAAGRYILDCQQSDAKGSFGAYYIYLERE